MGKIYEYSELKGIIQVGDEVRAVPGRSNPCGQIRDNGSTTGIITKVTSGDFYINDCWHLSSG